MSRCSRCGAEFSCAMTDAPDQPCWCAALPPLLPVPGQEEAASCWCPACLEQAIAAQRSN